MLINDAKLFKRLHSSWFCGNCSQRIPFGSNILRLFLLLYFAIFLFFNPNVNRTNIHTYIEKTLYLPFFAKCLRVYASLLILLSYHFTTKCGFIFRCSVLSIHYFHADALFTVPTLKSQFWFTTRITSYAQWQICLLACWLAALFMFWFLFVRFSFKCIGKQFTGLVDNVSV